MTCSIEARSDVLGATFCNSSVEGLFRPGAVPSRSAAQRRSLLSPGLVTNDFRRQRCPACGDPAIAEVGKVRAAHDVEYSTHAIVLERVPEIWACRACGSWFTQNAVPPETSQSLYSSGSSGARWVAEPFEKAKDPALLAEFDRHITRAARVLDIGCSAGQLLDYAKARGAETCGMDYSAACGDTIKRKGHRFATALSEFDGERFDVVTAFDVIEHVYDLPRFFVGVAHLLEPGGKFIVLTGDIGSLGARICGSRWWYLRYPEHIVFPSRRFFGSQPAGLRLERTVRTYASVGYRVPFLHALRIAAALAMRGNYDGLPALGPDHLLMVLRRD